MCDNLCGWIYHILVGGLNPSEKYESQLGLLFPSISNIWKNKTCSKPPTRWYMNLAESSSCLSQYVVLSMGIWSSILWRGLFRGGFSEQCCDLWMDLKVINYRKTTNHEYSSKVQVSVSDMVQTSPNIYSGKRLHNYGKSPPWLIWVNQLQIYGRGFNSCLYVYQKVYSVDIPLNHYKIPLNHYN